MYCCDFGKRSVCLENNKAQTGRRIDVFNSRCFSAERRKANSMSYIPVDSKFKLRLLALSISLLFIPYAHALQPISDADLGESTGEGIAFLPENFSVLLQGPNNTNPTAADLNDRTKDTGYIRLIPVGPLTTEAQNSGAGKADIYLYGLAISQSNQAYGAARTSADWNNRFGRAINSWGSMNNPWLFKVETATGVPNFSAASPADTGAGDVTFLGLEAPLYNADVNGYTYDANGKLTGGSNSGVNGLSAAEKSAYNLKLGLWADAFVRDPSKPEGDANQFALAPSGTSDINRANRLRLQGVWDGFSLNGTQLRVFQTLDKATNAGGMSTFYNNTLGLAGVLRLNGGDGQTLRASTSSATPTASSNGGTVNRYSTTYTGAPGENPSSDWLYRIRSITTTVNSTGTWTAPSVIPSVLRLSTQEIGTTQGLINTPAINGGLAPTFNPNEGLFLYNPNINVVLGSLYQPLTVGVAADGRNLALEIARIPNKSSIYTKIYTRYAGDTGDAGVTYSGSTCNIYQCGSNVSLGGVSYQGATATHSSISIGSTEYNKNTNTLTAYSGAEAVGISFGALPATQDVSKNTYFYQLQNQERRRGSSTSCGWFCNEYVNWQYRIAAGWTGNAGTGLRFDSQNANWVNISDTGYYNPSVANSGYTVTNADSTQFIVPATTGKLPDARYENGRWYSTAPNPDLNNHKLTPSQVSSGVMNNFGSAVIDGLLIQHMKITTKGL